MTSEERVIKCSKVTSSQRIAIRPGRWWKRYTHKVLRAMFKRKDRGDEYRV